MSFLDRIAAAVMPAASEESRLEARRRADEMAAGEPWLAKVLDHHRQIESRIEQALGATGSDEKRRHIQEMARVLTGHSMAEEAVLYPEVAESSSKTHAGMAYEEHAMTKIEVAQLEKLDPASKDWREKLEHIQSALQQHMYQEEDSWLPDLVRNLPTAEKSRITGRFIEEYERYCGADEQTVPARERLLD